MCILYECTNLAFQGDNEECSCKLCWWLKVSGYKPSVLVIQKHIRRCSCSLHPRCKRGRDGDAHARYILVANEDDSWDYGYVQVGISNDKLHMVFEDDVAIDDQYFSNEIPIEADFEIDEHLAALLGYESVTIEAGTYEVDFSNYGTYGEAYFDIDVVANDVPSVYTTKPKIKFKHSGGNTQCNGCKCPLGICITVGFVSSTGGISVEEYRDHVAQAQIGIEDDQVHLIFEVPVADENDEIVLSSDFYIDEVVAEALGYEAIEISSGTYTVDFSNYESYGEVFLDANLEE